MRAAAARTPASLLLERVPTTIFRAAKGLGRPSHLGATLADRPVEVARDRILEVERALAHATCEVEVDIVQMDVLDPTRGQLDHLDRVGPRDHEVGDVQADTSLGAHQQPFDLLRPLNDAAKPGLHGELEPVPRAHVLDRADQVEQVRPLRVGKQSLVCTHRMAFGYRREDQRFGADRREPVRMPVDVRQLRSTDAVVMEDRVDLPGDDVETMPPQHCLGVVAAVR